MPADFTTAHSATMSHAELLTRAREAYIASRKPLRWVARRIRAGKCDHRLAPILTALYDLERPVSAIIADRDEATVAMIMRLTPGLPVDDSVAAALLTAVRVGRRG